MRIVCDTIQFESKREIEENIEALETYIEEHGDEEHVNKLLNVMLIELVGVQMSEESKFIGKKCWIAKKSSPHYNTFGIIKSYEDYHYQVVFADDNSVETFNRGDIRISKRCL